MILGIAQVAGGSLGALVVQAPERFLSLVVGAFILAALCIALGILLMPERSISP